MKRNSTSRFIALGRFMSSTLIFLAVSYCSMAQISLVRWDMQGLGPTVAPTTNLSMNNGKLISAVGTATSAFVTSDCNVGLMFLANGWNNGPGTSYYVANFATTNYSSNTIQFKLAYLSTFGPHIFQTAYSVGSINGPWTDVGSVMNFSGTPGNCGIVQTPTINLPAACDNKTNVWVRVYTTENITINGWTGSPSWDDVEVKGNAMTAPSITGNPSNSTVCEGADATFTVAASNAISYQWQFRTSSAGVFANCPSNALFDNETTATLTVNNVTAAMSGYQFLCIVTGGTTPNAISTTATMTVNAYGTWNGSVNTNWNNASNWNCNLVPDATTNVTISSGGNQPVVNITNATCNNLTINSGATLSFTGTTNVLDVKGTASGTGTLNGTLGKVVFSGTGAQTIPGGTYKDLQMNGSGGKTLGGNASITGVLTLTSGTITLGSNNLTLTSTASAIASANANSFIVTNGTGALINQNIGSGGKTGNINFPIGATAASYTPMVLNNNAGTADNFTAQVKDGIFSSYSGTTGSGAITSNAVNKTWHMSEGTAGGSNATLQLTWNGTNELNNFDRENCKLAHFVGSVWNSAAPLTFAVGADPYTVSRTGITSFSPFGIGSAGSPLPLDLIAFEGAKNNNGILLKWTTVNEKAVLYFNVERSADGNSYVPVGRVSAKNTGMQTEYQFNDKTADLPVVVFYRLNMNFENGKEKYSTVVRIKNAEEVNSNIYPNPVKEGILNLKLQPSMVNGTISIIDMSGKVVYTKQLSADEINKGLVSISVKSLANGNYILNLNTDSGTMLLTSKFIKQ